MNKLKAIQGVVILMTSLIIAGIGAVIYGLATRGGEDVAEVVAVIAPTQSPSPTASDPRADFSLSEPRGSKIAAIQTCGGNLCTLVTGGGLSDRVIIIDSKGNTLRKVTLNAEK